MIARNLSFKTVVLLVGIGPEYKKFGKNFVKNSGKMIGSHGCRVRNLQTARQDVRNFGLLSF